MRILFDGKVIAKWTRSKGYEIFRSDLGSISEIEELANSDLRNHRIVMQKLSYDDGTVFLRQELLVKPNDNWGVVPSKSHQVISAPRSSSIKSIFMAANDGGNQHGPFNNVPRGTYWELSVRGDEDPSLRLPHLSKVKQPFPIQASEMMALILHCYQRPLSPSLLAKGMGTTVPSTKGAAGALSRVGVIVKGREPYELTSPHAAEEWLRERLSNEAGEMPRWIDALLVNPEVMQGRKYPVPRNVAP